MGKRKYFLFMCFVIGISSFSCGNNSNILNTDEQFLYCDKQLRKTLREIGDTCVMPRSINPGKSKWNITNIYDWTSGFWPGILWYDYEYSGNEYIKDEAIRFTQYLQPLTNPEHTGDHDIGFQLFCSYGNAYRLTKDEKYKQYIFAGAEKLAKLYNPVVGTTLSWPNMVKEKNWPHNTIMDNMMNLEILFWTSKNGGNKRFYDMAVRHAEKTMENHFREDGSCYHVAVYDTITGKFIKGVTNQGINDNSMWARGQAWAIYGYTMVYRETKDKRFLRFAEKITDIYLKRLPEDYVPYWDFDDPAIPKAPKDASSAAIVTSALLELSQLEDNADKAQKYRNTAEKMLKNLALKYLSLNRNPAFLQHSTGNYPGGYEIDASINYADYYYIEALTRYRKLTKI